MAEFKTPTTKRCKSRVASNTDLQTPLKIPASPFLQQIGYGCGVGVFTLERSPKVGFVRSPWAIKKRNSVIPKDPKYDERIRLEAKILRNLNHPNIVGFRGFAEMPHGKPCLAMEKLDTSLGDAIEQRRDAENGPFPAKVISKVAYELVKGLEYLHHVVHILHADLKSFNVLISEDLSRVKICDFGVSLPLTESLEVDTSKGNFVYIGTSCWNPPEVIDESDIITNKADIWTYGLVLWEMISLSVPHGELDESTMDLSIDDLSIDQTLSNEEDIESCKGLDNSVVILEDIKANKYGTRPALPAIDLDSLYETVLEIFFICTEKDQTLRPSAKALVTFFEKQNSCKS